MSQSAWPSGDPLNNNTNDLNPIITDNLYPLALIIPITIAYGVIFLTGVVGNVSTCTVIARNKSMHTATNYYLFSLAISDMLLLVSGLPPEMYRLWSPENYVFGQAFCIVQGFAAETSANATVLTITAFTVERYVAICHPFLSHTMSKLSRAVRFIVAIWVVALCLAAPQAIQFGVEYEVKNGTHYSRCTVVSNVFQHAFEISTFLFFVGPMTLITVLYVLIGVQLRKSRGITAPKRPSLASACADPSNRHGSHTAAQNRVVKMLIAVVAAFFICWAPFHAQRLLAVYLASTETQDAITVWIYMALMYISGILYFLSTTINPVLYHIMSNKFREAFKKTLTDMCGRSKKRHSLNRSYSVLSRCPPSMRHLQRSVSDGVQQHEQISLRGAKQTRLNSTAQRSRTISGNSDRFQTAVTTLSETVPPTLVGTRREDENTKNRKTFNFYIFGLFGKRKRNNFNNNLYRQSSVESTHTISNSSLQDMDEMDYSSSDLVKYMEEINEFIA